MKRTYRQGETSNPTLAAPVGGVLKSGPMDVSALCQELYGRIPPLVRLAVDGLSLEQLATSPAPEVNTVAWLVWHTARVQDHHLSEVTGEDQVWVAGDWGGRFALASDPSNTGYGHRTEEMAAVRPETPEVLVEYFDAVERRSRPMLARLTATDLDRVVDQRWDPPVTLGVRLVSIADDSLQHLGQAAYLRGMLKHES